MTYNVFGGTLNLAQLLVHLQNIHVRFVYEGHRVKVKVA